MTEDWQAEVIRIARQQWDADDSYEAGKTIVEHIAEESRKDWAASALEHVYDLIEPKPEIDAVLDLAHNSEKWGQGTEALYRAAHEIVYGVRLTSNEARDISPLEDAIYYLAYLAGKTIFNSRQFLSPFDHDAAWKLVSCAKQIGQLTEDENLTKTLWETISNRQLLTVRVPKPCFLGIGCPFCGELYDWPPD